MRSWWPWESPKKGDEHATASTGTLNVRNPGGEGYLKSEQNEQTERTLGNKIETREKIWSNTVNRWASRG